MAAVDASSSSGSPGGEAVSRAYWLPPHGRGNGLDASAWAPVADVPADDVAALLAELAAADVPGYAAEVGKGSRTRCRIWVGSLRYATAEDVLGSALGGRAG